MKAGPRTAGAPELILRIEGVNKWFGDFQVLKDIDLVIAPGEVVVICGPSGSGKSTLLRCINYLEPIQGGHIYVAGQLVGMRRTQGRLVEDHQSEINRLRAQIGMVFQRFNLFPHMTALGNVSEGLVTVQRLGRRKAAEIALAMLTKVGLADKRDSYPAQLSGGQQQRVAIARALAMGPRLMLFDEPTSALDPELTGEVLAVMRQLAQEGMTMVIVTHEMGFAREAADRIVFMDEGRILAAVPPTTFFTAPPNERARNFLSRILH